MRLRTSAWIGLVAGVLAACGTRAESAEIVVEPDDYAPGTVLNDVVPEVSLFAAVNATDLTGNFGFNVTSAVDSLATTGSQVFAHVNIPFFNGSRNFRMTFTNPVSAVSLDAIPSTDFFNENAILTIYDENEVQLDQLILPGLGGGIPQTLALSRQSADIKYAVVSSDGPFLRLDNLSFDTEPPVVPVVIDVKPGGDENPINLHSNSKSRGRSSSSGGVIPVAILTTDDFDATTTVPDAEILLGDPELGTAIPPVRGTLEDVDDDSDLDVLLHFSIGEMVEAGAIDEESRILALTASTLDGLGIVGMDMVTIVP